MATIRVTATVRNMAAPERSWDGLFLVDTDTVVSVVPRQHLEAIGVTPHGSRVHEVDGIARSYEVAAAAFEFFGELVGASVLFGDADAEPRLGLTALASAGIERDPVTGRLERRPPRLKGLRAA